MIERVQKIIAAFNELLVQVVPMPWRMAITLLVLIILFYLLIWRILPWLLRLSAYALFGIVELVASILLLPEYFATRQMRRFGRPPLWGSYIYGDCLQGIVRFCHVIAEGLDKWLHNRRTFPWLLFILLAALPLAAWYVQPYLADSSVGFLVDAVFAWWYRFETWVLTGGWP